MSLHLDKDPDKHWVLVTVGYVCEDHPPRNFQGGMKAREGNMAFMRVSVKISSEMWERIARIHIGNPSRFHIPTLGLRELRTFRRHAVRVGCLSSTA